MGTFKAGDKVVLKRNLGDYKVGDVVTIKPAIGYSALSYDWSAEADGQHQFHVHNHEIQLYYRSTNQRLVELEDIIIKLQVQLDALTEETPKITGLEEFRDYPVEYIYEDKDNERFVKVGLDSWILITPSTRRSNESYIYRDHNMANR